MYNRVYAPQMATKASSTIPEAHSFLSKHFRQDNVRSKYTGKADVTTGPFQRPSSGSIPRFQFGKTKPPQLNFQSLSRSATAESQNQNSEAVLSSTQAGPVSNQEGSNPSNASSGFGNVPVFHHDSTSKAQTRDGGSESRMNPKISTLEEAGLSEKPLQVSPSHLPQNQYRVARSTSLHSLPAQSPVIQRKRSESTNDKTASSSQQRLLEYVAQLQRDLDDAENRIKEISVSCSREKLNLQEEVGVVKSQLTSEHKALLAMETQLKESIAETTALRNNIKTYRDKLHEMQSVYEESKNVFGLMKEECQTIQDLQNELFSDRDALRAALTKTTAQQVSLQNQLSQLKNESALAESLNANRLRDLQDQKDVMASALAEQLDDNMRLQQHILSSSVAAATAWKEEISEKLEPISGSLQGLRDVLECNFTKLDTEVIQTGFVKVTEHINQQFKQFIGSVSATEAEISGQLRGLSTKSELHQNLKDLHSEQTASLSEKIDLVFQGVKASKTTQESQEASIASLEQDKGQLSTEKSQLEVQIKDIMEAHDLLASENVLLEDLLLKERAKCRFLEFDIERHLSNAVDQSNTLQDLRNLVSSLQIRSEESHQRGQITESENPHLISACGTLKGCEGPGGMNVELNLNRTATNSVTPQRRPPMVIVTPVSRNKKSKNLDEDFAKRLEFIAVDVTASKTPSVSPSSSISAKTFYQNDSPLMLIRKQ